MDIKALKDLGVLEEKVETPRGTFAVRGLSLTDILALSEKYFPVMAEMFDQFSGVGTASAETVAPQQMAGTLLKGAPDAAAEVIALAAGSYDAETIQAARTLPFTVQIDALNKIGQLTFRSEEDLGKAVAAVVSMLKASGRAVSRLSSEIPT